MVNHSDELLDRVFSRPEITVVRHAVSAQVAAAGLAGDRLDGFVLAVNEIITNVVLHAGGAGRIRLWVTDGAVHCEVVDNGPGIPERYLSGDRLPSALDVGGRGVWLAHQLCDSVRVSSSASGSTVTMVSRLRARPASPDLQTGVSAPGS